MLGSSEYSKYYFDHTRFNREALSPKVFLIIGRRGAGKTALSQFFSFQQLMPNVTTIEVDEPAAFQQLMSKMAESCRKHSRSCDPQTRQDLGIRHLVNHLLAAAGTGHQNQGCVPRLQTRPTRSPPSFDMC